MASRNSHGKLRSKKIEKYPLITIDHDADFASIKLAKGIEACSYLKDGFLFCEDAKGKIIEIQVLNLSQLKDLKSKLAS